MNLAQAAIVLRERKALEVADLSLRFVRALAPLLYVRLGAWLLVPSYALCLTLRYAFDVEWGYVWLCAYGLCIVTQGPFTILAGRLLFSDRPTARSVLADWLKSSPVYVTLLVLRALLLVASAVTFVGPFVVWVYGAYLHEVVLLESAGLRGALGRSRRFVRGRSGSAIEMLLLITSTFAIFITLGELFGRTLLGFVLQIDRPLETLADDDGSIFALAGAFLAVPLATTLRFLFYVNERTVRDGWDVQVRFLGIRDDLERRAR